MNVPFAATVLAGCLTAVGAAAAPSVRSVHVLPDLPLAAFQNARLQTSIGDDHGILLGSTGSDLFRTPGDATGTFWMLTDRGPNPVKRRRKEERRTFPVPAFTPHILEVRALGGGGVLEVRTAIPLVGTSGRPVTGLPNLEGRDEPAFDRRGRKKLPFAPSGLDTEGLVRMRDGTFWVADEYGPSLVHVDATGKVLVRLVPEGLDLPGSDYPVRGTLPAAYLARRGNRGFEALAVSPDGRTLSAGLQSPLTTEADPRATRILAVDAASGRPVAEHAYLLESAIRREDGKTEDWCLSALAALDDGSLLALERTEALARLYRVDPAASSPSAPLAKTLVADLSSLPGIPSKLEGLAIIDRNTVAVANDDDFGAAPSVIVIVELRPVAETP